MRSLQSLLIACQLWFAGLQSVICAALPAICDAQPAVSAALVRCLPYAIHNLQSQKLPAICDMHSQLH